VDTIQSAFGEISGSFTSPHIPNIDFTTLKELLQPAMAIALLGGIESLLSAVVADGMIGARHRSNMELIAQGAANIGSAIFGGIPATGAIARTATNIKNGGRTPIAGIVHALVLLGIMLLFAPLAELIPLSCLAGILIIVAYNMSEWRNFSKLLKSPMADVAILISTFLLTVFVDLVVAIELGIVLSSLSFMKRMSDMNQVANMLNDDAENSDNENLFDQELTDIPKGVVLYEINGPLFFGAAQKFQDTFRDIGSSNSVLVIRMRHVPFIDATGLLRLKEMVQHFNHQQIEIVLSGVNDTVLKELRRSNIDILIGSENILPNIRESLIRAREIIHELHH
jgi:SulP family sulfate permease